MLNPVDCAADGIRPRRSRVLPINAVLAVRSGKRHSAADLIAIDLNARCAVEGEAVRDGIAGERRASAGNGNAATQRQILEDHSGRSVERNGSLKDRGVVGRTEDQKATGRRGNGNRSGISPAIHENDVAGVQGMSRQHGLDRRQRRARAHAIETRLRCGGRETVVRRDAVVNVVDRACRVGIAADGGRKGCRR